MGVRHNYKEGNRFNHSNDKNYQMWSSNSYFAVAVVQFGTNISLISLFYLSIVFYVFL